MFSLLCSIYVIYRRKTISISTKELAMATAALFFICFYSISLTWSLSEGYGNWKTIRLLLVIPAVFLFPFVAYINNSKPIIVLYYMGFLLSLFLSIDVIYSTLFANYSPMERIGTNYINISRPIGIGILFSIFLYLKRGNGIYLLSLFTMFFAMLLTGARGPLISIVLCITIYAIWVISKDFNNIGYGTPAFMVTAIGITGVLIHSFGGRTITRLEVLFDGGGTSFGARVDMFYSSIGFIQQSPLIGHGIGSFPILYRSSDGRVYPHNIILETLVEVGVIGTVLFLIFLAIPYLIATRRRSSQPVLSGLIVSSITYTLLNAMVSGDIYANVELFTFILTTLVLIENKDQS